MRTQRTTAAILDAAQRHFVTNGYAATRVDAIAPDAGLSKGAIYFHFATKQDLLVALIDRSSDTVFAPALALLDDAGVGAVGRIIAYFNAVGSLSDVDRYLLPVLLSVQGEGVPDAARARLTRLRRTIHGSLVRAIDAGRRTREVTSSLPSDTLASLVAALMDGMLIHWFRDGAVTDGPGFLRAGRHAVLGLLGVPRAASRS